MIEKGFNTRKHGSMNDPSLKCSISDNSTNDFIVNRSRKIIIMNSSNMAQQILIFFHQLGNKLLMIN